ncbi:small multi-drug export protein [Chloroflexota bacterium]
MITALSNINLVWILVIVTVDSIAMFLILWYLLSVFYHKKSSKWVFINRFVEKMRGKGESPLIKRYGLIGLALLIAIPLPTVGVFGGTLLSWLMGTKWLSSLIAVQSGAIVSNSLILFSVFGIGQAIGLFG